MQIKERSSHLSKNRLKMFAYILLCVIFIIACVVTPIYIWLSSDIEGKGITSIRGDSMTPTIHNNEILYVQPTQFERGEIVVARCPGSEKYSATTDTALLKRIVGLPGETVEIVDYGVLINGVLLEEEYTTTQDKTLSADNDFEELILSDNEYFLLGDNRENSFDSRHVGAVHSSAFLYGLTTEPNTYTYSLIVKWILIAIAIIAGYILAVVGTLVLFTRDFKAPHKQIEDKQKRVEEAKIKTGCNQKSNAANSNNKQNSISTKSNKSQPKSEKNQKKAERAEKARAEQLSKNYKNKPKRGHKK